MILLFAIFSLIAPKEQVDTLYQQKLTWLGSNMFDKNVRGTIYITKDSIHFKDNNQLKQRNFSLATNEVTKVKMEWAYLFPNRISIHRHDKKYLFYTYRRKKLKKAILDLLQDNE